MDTGAFVDNAAVIEAPESTPSTAPIPSPRPPSAATTDKAPQKRRLEKTETGPPGNNHLTPPRKLSDSALEPPKCPLLLPTSVSKRYRMSSPLWQAVRAGDGDGDADAKAKDRNKENVADVEKSSDDERDLAVVRRLLAKTARFTEERAAQEELLARMRREEAELVRRVRLYDMRVAELEKARHDGAAQRDELEEACSRLRAEKEDLGIEVRNVVNEKQTLEAINRGLRRENRALEENQFELKVKLDALVERVKELERRTTVVVD